MFNFVAWIVAGGVLGLLASRRLPGNTAPGTLLNSLAGAVGGFAGGLLVRSALAALDPAPAHVGAWALAAAFSSAALLVGVVNLQSRGRRVAVAPAKTQPPQT